MFELDYWGVSSKKLSNFFNNKLEKNNCIISSRSEGLNYLINQGKNCFIPFKDLHKKNSRPFYVVLMERSLDKGLPNNCKNIYNEKININFSRENLVLAKIFECR